MSYDIVSKEVFDQKVDHTTSRMIFVFCNNASESIATSYLKKSGKEENI